MKTCLTTLTVTLEGQAEYKTTQLPGHLFSNKEVHPATDSSSGPLTLPANALFSFCVAVVRCAVAKPSIRFVVFLIHCAKHLAVQSLGHSFT